jgi:hypothetical protein
MIKKLKALAKLLCTKILVMSCTKKEILYTKENLLALTPAEGDDRMETVLGQSATDIIPCSDYGEGCVAVHRFKSRKLEYIAVEYATIAQAQDFAPKIRAWTARNWLFDDVYNEPSLELWLCQYLECLPPKGSSRKAGDVKGSDL